MLYDASSKETLDVSFRTRRQQRSRLARALTGALAAHLTGRLKDIQESAERSDITYLANKSGWDARAVALAALADQFSARTASTAAPAIPAPFFYALFRAGAPANEDVLYHIDPATVTNIWKTAIAQGVIPASATGQVAQMATRFQTISAQKLLTGPALAGVSPLKDMLSVSGLSDAQQQQFATLYAANRKDTAAFGNQ